jgi:endonuclease YncB( thermonuclease family)
MVWRTFCFLRDGKAHSRLTLEDQKLYGEGEDSARSAKLGLWIDPDPIPPWDFRHRR